MSTISPYATSGFASASEYDTHRPSYPPSSVASLLSALKIEGVKGTRIIDLAAGTGKFTELLVKREEEYEILAIEPHEGMRGELVSKGLKGVDVRDGTAEKMGVEREWADAVICAQADLVMEVASCLVFPLVRYRHPDFDEERLRRRRFSNDDALEEIYNALIPGGALGIIWNVEDYNAPESWTPSTQWEAKMKDITWSFDDSQPRFRHEEWRQPFEKQLSSTPFTIQAADPLFSLPLGEASEKFVYWLKPEAIWDRYHSLSQIAVLEGGELAKVKSQVFEVLKGDGVERNDLGEIALHGHTVWVWTNSIPGAPLKEGG